ncbi:MAG: hypothetical protein RJA61_263 [Candidatus Parcubacteria bacterium]|jgi:hypothetical protein
MNIYLKKSKTAKAVSGFVGFAMALSFVFGGVVAPVQAQSVSDLTAQINSLLSTIAALQSQLNSLSGSSTTGTGTGFVFNTNLTIGSTGTDVMNLQKTLNMNADTRVSTTGAGSPGSETSTFGPATKAAVIKFQLKYGISPAAGFVGPVTRAKLNTMGGSTGSTGGTTVIPGVAGTLTVSAASQPAASLAPQSAARIPFTRITLTAGGTDVTVNSVTVERTALAADAAFSGIVLLDQNGIQLGTAKTLNSNHQAVIGEAFTVPAGTSRTYTVAGNMASDLSTRAGQVAALTVVGINTSATVVGSLPITGALHTINASLSLGSAVLAVSSFDPNTSSTKEIGTTNYKFAGIRVTAGSAEQVRLHSVRWNQTGSVSANDLANLKVVVDGTSYDAVVSKDGKYFTASFGSGILIDKGFSKDVHVQGDIVGSNASGRTVIFDIDKNSDIYVSGELFGYGITPTANSTSSASDDSSQFTTGTPFFDGSKVTITGGTVTTVSKASSAPAQNIAVNVPNQVLGGFEINVRGEPISVQQIVVNVLVTGSGGQVVDLTNVSIVDQNGATVAGPVDASGAAASGTITFTDTITFGTGLKSYVLKGQVGSDFTNGQTITASTTPSSNWTNVRGELTGNTLTLTNGAVTFNTMTVKAAALAISISGQPAAQNVVAGTNGLVFTNIQLDATASGEDVRLSSIPLELTFGGAATANLLDNCQIFDGATSLTNSDVVSASDLSGNASGDAETFTFDNALTVPKGTVKTLTLKCNLSSSSVTSNTFSWGIDAAPSITVTGVTSSNAVTETVTAFAGQTMTVAGTGTLTVIIDPSSPSYTVVAGGQSNVTLATLKLRAANEPIRLERIALQLTNSASSSANDLVGGQVTIWDGATQVGSATFVGSSRNATSTLTSTFTIPRDTDKVLTLKGDISDIGVSKSGTSGHLVAVNYDGNDSTGTRGIGQDSSSTINTSSTSDTAAEGVRMFNTFPTFTKLSVPTNTLNNGSQSLLRFKVDANSANDLGIYKFTVKIATTTAIVTNINIFGFTDSGFSTPVSGITSGGQLEASDVSGVDSSGIVEIYANTSSNVVTTLQIPAGGSRWFEVRGTVAGAATGTSVQTQIEGDAAFPSLSGFTSSASGIDADANDDFIWSPNSTGTTAVDTDDFTNGFGLIGLPTTNMTAEVLSK